MSGRLIDDPCSGVALASVWLRDGRVIIVPLGGHGSDIEPVGVVEPDPDEVGRAVREALMTSAASPVDVDLPPRGWKSPVLRAAGVRSYSKLYAGAALCLVVSEGESVFIEPWQPAKDGRGFERSGTSSVSVEEPSALGPLVLQALGCS